MVSVLAGWAHATVIIMRTAMCGATIAIAHRAGRTTRMRYMRAGSGSTLKIVRIGPVLGGANQRVAVAAAITGVEHRGDRVTLGVLPLGVCAGQVQQRAGDSP